MILFPNRENLPVSPGCTMFHHFVSSGQFRNVNSRECDHRMKVDTPGNHHAVIPVTFEFDRFLCQKLTIQFFENTQQNPGYAFQPAPFGFLHRSYDRSRSLHYRDYIQSCLDLHLFLWHILPGTSPYGSVNPKRPEYI